MLNHFYLLIWLMSVLDWAVKEQSDHLEAASSSGKKQMESWKKQKLNSFKYLFIH